jgi:ATP-binding cassette subfamily F protein uup
MNLMRLEQVHLAYGAAPLLDGVDLQIDMGDRICLIGRNGAGKSSLMKLLSGEQTVDAGTVWRSPACRIGYLEQDLPEREDLNVAEVVAMGLADVYELRQQHAALTSGELDTAGMEKLEAISHRLDELDGWQMENKVERILSRLQLDGSRQLSELSGGWRRRVSLARALVAEPTLLLLDEPTNHLDLLAIEWLEQQLQGFNGAIVFITHDRRFLKALANRIMELDRGQLNYFPGNYERFLEYREQQLAEEERHNALFDKKLAQEEVWIRQGIKARRTRNEGRVRALVALRKERSERRERQGTAKMELAKGQESGKLICEMQDVGHSYDGKPLINNLDFTLMKGDRVGLVGANGVGKSTLLRILLGELTPSQGKVKMGTRLQVAYFDQLRDQLDLEKTVMDNLAEGRESIEINGKHKHVMGYLGDFLFSPARVRSPVSSLSGGERNRLLLAKLFSKPANILVLDEPTNDLDIETLELLEELLSDFGGTVLLVSHDRDFLDQVVTTCLVFDGQGQIEESVGGYSDWYDRGGRLTSAQSMVAEVEKPAVVDTPKSVPQAATAAKPKKLSYKVQRELDQLPGLIEELEGKVEGLQEEMAAPDFYSQDHAQVNAKLEQLASVEAELETAMERWMEIEEMLE